MGGRLDDQGVPPKRRFHLVDAKDGGGDVAFPREIARLLDSSADAPQDLVWDSFLNSFGDLLLKTAAYSHRRHFSASDSNDATMDAYAFILEKLRQDDLRRLRGFSGGDEAAFSRWLAVVARRLCTDFWRRRYGRVRPTTPRLDRDTRRRLVDEVWDPREPSEFPAGKMSDPEWNLRNEERRDALDSAVKGLEPRDQLLLAFRFEEGLSARQISDLMNFRTPFHVYRRLTRVLAVLRERLEGMGIEDPDP
jgi:RNA polymerase sigma factor (sigma-70 family)